jgi:hypothetical protein
MSGRHRAAHFGAMQHDRPAPGALARSGAVIAPMLGAGWPRSQACFTTGDKGDGATTPAA